MDKSASLVVGETPRRSTSSLGDSREVSTCFQEPQRLLLRLLNSRKRKKVAPKSCVCGYARIGGFWLQVSLITHHDDPAVWGIALADAIASCCKSVTALNGAISENNALVRMKQTFDAEWGAPTDLPEGRLRT